MPESWFLVSLQPISTHGYSERGEIVFSKDQGQLEFGSVSVYQKYININAFLLPLALQAIHGAVHAAHIGLKYTWFGSGYLSNMYFRMIADKPIYKMMNVGGDLAFTACIQGSGQALTNRNIAVGDPEGNPIPQTSW